MYPREPAFAEKTMPGTIPIRLASDMWKKLHAVDDRGELGNPAADPPVCWIRDVGAGPETVVVIVPPECVRRSARHVPKPRPKTA